MTSCLLHVACLLALTTLTPVCLGAAIDDEQGPGKRRDADDTDPQLACVFQCDKGKPVDNPDHTPSFNGCGSYGFNVDFKTCPYLTSCCNAHDICYDTCGKTRPDCDERFRACGQGETAGDEQRFLAALDDDVALTCRTFGYGMYLTVLALGCPAFTRAQKDACLCV